MANAIPKISIIIRAKNEEQFIGETLSAIFKQEIDLPFEVIAIDSGSTDHTLEIVSKFNVRQYEIKPSQFTFGYALNYGARLAVGEYLINLSAHCIPVDSKWMANLLDPLQSDPLVAATYGKQLPIKGLNPYEERLTIIAFSPNSEGRIKAVFSNSNCAIRKKVWEKYPFDEKASFAEDFIWSQVLPSEDILRYVPDAAVYHTHPLTLKYWTKRYYDNGLLEQYLLKVCGFKYPWRSQSNKGKHIIVKKLFMLMPFLRTAQSYVVEFYDVIAFLLKNSYFRYILFFPIYFILKRYYFYKGTLEGRRRYGSSIG